MGYVIAATASETEVWVTGYVAGYVINGDFEDANCEFSASEVSGSTNYLNSINIILSEVAPMQCSVGNSVPCQLSVAVRPILGLRLNPSIFAKKVKLKCNIKKYLGTMGIGNITEVVEL